MRLGLTIDQFWRMTPRQLRQFADVDRQSWDQQREHNELCAAIVAHTVAVFAGKSLKSGKELNYGNFMPSMQEKLEAMRRQQAAQSFHNLLQGMAREKGWIQ